MIKIVCSSAIGCGFPVEEALDRIAAIGLQDADLLTIEGWAHINPSALAADFDATSAQIDALLAKRGLKLRSLNAMLGPKMHERDASFSEPRTQQTQALLKLMRKHGFSTIALQPPLKWQETWSNEEQDRCIATLQEQLALAKNEGVCFALELHTRSPFETMDQVRRLMDAIPDVPLVYDPTHFIMQGIPLKDTAWMLNNTRHCHVRDAAQGQLQAPFGQGSVDWDWLTGSLKDSGFSGVVSIEYLGSKDTPFDVLDSAKRLASLLQEKLT